MSKIVPFTEIQDMSLAVFRGGVFGLKNQEQIMTLMLIAQAENIHPMKALMQYDIIQGRPALKSTEVLSRFQKSGGSIQWIKTDSESAKAKFTHPQGGEFEFEYSIEDAGLAGLKGKDNWIKRPKEMLRARCVSAGVRMAYPACLSGLYTSDEVEDSPIERTKDNPYSLPSMPITGEVIETEVEPSIDKLKIELACELKPLGFNNADIRQFADMFGLKDDVIAIKELLNDKELLIKKVAEFEEK